jgi:hypothetical protein
LGFYYNGYIEPERISGTGGSEGKRLIGRLGKKEKVLPFLTHNWEFCSKMERQMKRSRFSEEETIGDIARSRGLGAR